MVVEPTSKPLVEKAKGWLKLNSKVLRTLIAWLKLVSTWLKAVGIQNVPWRRAIVKTRTKPPQKKQESRNEKSSW